MTTPFGLFEFARLSLGLRNATQTFQPYMDSLLRDLPFVRTYIDDIIVMSRDQEEHLRHLRALFERLRQAHLNIRLDKCTFGRREVDFLGYTVSRLGYRPPKKVETLSSISRNRQRQRHFAGFLAS